MSKNDYFLLIYTNYIYIKNLDLYYIFGQIRHKKMTLLKQPKYMIGHIIRFAFEIGSLAIETNVKWRRFS